MGETKHTQGPWTIGLVDHQHDIENCPNIKLDMPGNDGVFITGTHREANANLIATAPELLETLRADAAFLRRYLEELIHVPTKDERGNIVNGFAAAQIPDWSMRQRLSDIEDAIAKAEGR